jgi:hypothetical protein
MSHVDEGTLQAFLDDQLPGAERTHVAAHLERCPECRGVLDELRADARLFAAALPLLDAASDVTQAGAAFRRRARPALRLSLGGTVPPVRRAFLRAAGLVLATAAVASAAIPGSPVRSLIVAVVDRTGDLFRGERAAPTRTAPAPTAETPAPPLGGVGAPLEDGRIRFVLRNPSRDLRIHVRLVDGEKAGIETLGGATSARLHALSGRIEMTGGGAGDVWIKIPRVAEEAHVEVNDKVYYYREGESVHIVAPGESTESEVVFKVQP